MLHHVSDCDGGMNEYMSNNGAIKKCNITLITANNTTRRARIGKIYTDRLMCVLIFNVSGKLFILQFCTRAICYVEKNKSTSKTSSNESMNTSKIMCRCCLGSLQGVCFLMKIFLTVMVAICVT